MTNKYCLCLSTYVSAFGFVGFILFFMFILKHEWNRMAWTPLYLWSWKCLSCQSLNKMQLCAETALTAQPFFCMFDPQQHIWLVLDSTWLKLCTFFRQKSLSWDSNDLAKRWKNITYHQWPPKIRLHNMIYISNWRIINVHVLKRSWTLGYSRDKRDTAATRSDVKNIEKPCDRIVDDAWDLLPPCGAEAGCVTWTNGFVSKVICYFPKP